MLFFQPAAHAMKTEQLSFLLSFVPVVTYFLQGIVDNHFPIHLFFTVLLSTLSLNIDILSIKMKKGGSPVSEYNPSD